MNPKAIMFDLDGTLLDTLLDLAESMNSVLEGMGFPAHPIEKYRYFVGDGMRMLAKRALPASVANEELIAACVQGMREEYGSRWSLKTRPYVGIPELLDELRRRDLSLTVFSNKPDDFTQQVVSHYFGEDCFSMVMGAGQFPPKPDPSGALYIAGVLGFTPEQFLYLGDTNTDMRTAVSAGMYPVGAGWGFRTKQELVESGAKIVISAPGQMLKVGGLLDGE